MRLETILLSLAASAEHAGPFDIRSALKQLLDSDRSVVSLDLVVSAPLSSWFSSPTKPDEKRGVIDVRSGDNDEMITEGTR